MPVTIGGDASFGPLSASDVTALDSALGVWTSYTPVITATSNPALGNATVNSKYTQIGKTVIWRCRITWGSTSTYGSGIWTFVPPVAAAGYGPSPVRMYDQSGNSHVMGNLYDGGAGPVISLNVSPNLVQPTVPFTWAVNDVLEFTMTYEAA